jgi:tetratricopeptide (TPR) repeat protein
MARLLNHELFSPKPVAVAYLKPAFAAAAAVALAAILAANWDAAARLFKTDEQIYREAIAAGRFDEALALALAAAEADPTSAAARLSVAQTYLQMALGGQNVAESLAAAAASARASLLIAETSGALATLGFTLELSGDFEGAEAEYLDALDVNPRDADVLAQLGWLYERQRRVDAARKFYDRAYLADPQNARARTFYARFLLGSGDSVHAAELAAGALSAGDPSLAAEANRILSSAYRNLGKVAEARPPAEAALALAPESAAALVNYGEQLMVELFGAGQLPFDETLAEVRDLADRAAAADPTLAAAPYLAFRAALSQKDGNAAARYSARALAILGADLTLSGSQREAIRAAIRDAGKSR